MSTMPVLFVGHGSPMNAIQDNAGDHAALADWHALGAEATLAIPTPEHYLPLLYALALQRNADDIEFFNDDVTGSISMTSLLIGATR